MAVALRLWPQLVQYHLLHRGHHIAVEQAIEHAHLDARITGRDQALGAGMVALEILDDGAALEHGALAILQDGEALEGPEGRQFGVGLGILQVAIVKRQGVLVEGDQHLLAVGRERVGIEFHDKAAPLRWVTTQSIPILRRLPPITPRDLSSRP
ncbi:hypothetical protein D3C80_1135680 [compost metagenome]